MLLAKHGCEVTHFDISQPMTDKAKKLAEEEGVLDKMPFVKGVLEDLKEFKDQSYDMVISFDAPISYTYPNQECVISELLLFFPYGVLTRANFFQLPTTLSKSLAEVRFASLVAWA